MFSSSIFVSMAMLVFIYLLLSLITNQVVNYVQEAVSSRALFLERGIQDMLGNSSLKDKLYEHPFIKPLSVANRKPSYIPSDAFASALFDILTEDALESQGNSGQTKALSERERFDALYKYVAEMKRFPVLSKLLLPILRSSDNSVLKAQVELEDYYNHMVESLSNSYRRKAQSIVLTVALMLAIILNADTIAFFNFPFTNMDSEGFFLGWTPTSVPGTVSGWLQKIYGIGLTTLVVSLLAPFWLNLQRIFSQLSFGRQRRNVAAAIDVLKKAEPQNVQEVAASQIELLNEYHKIVLDQSRKSFLSALAAALVGLGFFLGAVVSITAARLDVAIITALAGSFVEVISGVNFYLYGKTTTQMAEFQSRLDMTQRFLLANSICENLDGDFKQNTRSQLVLKILDPAVAKGAEQAEKQK